MQHSPSGHAHERRSSYQINRYPAAWIDVWHLRNGERLTLRPVLPQDGGLLGHMIEGLSRATRHNRFHGAVNGLSADALTQMSSVDYRRHLAFVITTVESERERVVADARYAVDESGEGAEFALVVDDRWQRKGLGERAMRALSHAAHRQGLSWLHGCVLSANAPMLSLMQRCQFCCTPDREDDHLVRVERSLAATSAKPSPTRSRSWFFRWLNAAPGAARS